MKKTVLLVAYAFWLLFAAWPGETLAGDSPRSGEADAGAMAKAATASYVIGAGDILEIMVWKNADLSKTLPVLPDGKLALPLVGEVAAGGETVRQFTEKLKTKLAVYMPEPVLSVSVQQVNSMLIYVVGRVNGPGMFALRSNINVLQALAMAKGLTPFAERDEIKIFRHQKGATKIFNFDYDDVSRGRKLRQNIQLERGDVIVVP